MPWHYLVTSIGVSKEESQPTLLEMTSDPGSGRKLNRGSTLKDGRLCYPDGHLPEVAGLGGDPWVPWGLQGLHHSILRGSDWQSSAHVLRFSPSGCAGPWPSPHPQDPSFTFKAGAPARATPAPHTHNSWISGLPPNSSPCIFPLTLPLPPAMPPCHIATGLFLKGQS